MKNLEYLLLIFLVVQSVFITVDGLTIWEAGGKRSVQDLLGRHGRALVFLAMVWVGYFTIQSLVMALMPTVETTVEWIARARNSSFQASNAPPSAWAPWLLIVAAYLVAGFWDYVIHRWMLHSAWFWFLHENHHLPTQVFNGMPGISVRPFVAPTTFLTYFCTTGTIVGALSLFQQPWVLPLYFEYLAGLILFFALIGSASHSCFLRKFRGPHRLLKIFFVTTPWEHILHHGAGVQGNYGNFTTFWDRVFGTYLDPLTVGYKDLRLGLAYDQDFLGTLTGGKWKLPRPWREKYEISQFCYLSAREPEAG